MQHHHTHKVSGRVQGAPGGMAGGAGVGMVRAHETMLGAGVMRHSPATLSTKKAGEILDDGEVHGKPLTKKARKYMQAVAHGMKPRKR